MLVPNPKNKSQEPNNKSQIKKAKRKTKENQKNTDYKANLKRFCPSFLILNVFFLALICLFFAFFICDLLFGSWDLLLDI
jgi:hypothetical protein